MCALGIWYDHREKKRGVILNCWRLKKSYCYMDICMSHETVGSKVRKVGRF